MAHIYTSWNTPGKITKRLRKQTKISKDLTTDETLLTDEDDEEQENKMYPVLGLSCFVYLLLVEEMEDMNFLQFLGNFEMITNLHLLVSSVAGTEHCAIYKGLELLDTLSKRLKEKSLVYRHDEFKDVTDIIKQWDFMYHFFLPGSYKCYDDVFIQETEIKGVQVLPNLVSKLDTRSQYGLLYTNLQDCSHAGVAGLLIYLLKEQVNQALSSSLDESWFQGSRVMSILQLVFKPPSEAGTEKDLVQETDRVMAALNCLRFILLRDDCDKTTVWENFTAIEKDFMEPLRQALKVTRIQYQAELTSKQDEMAGNKSNKKKQSMEFDVQSPDGETLELMPLSDQCEALQSGLYSLDMMESVLARITEIASSRTKDGGNFPQELENGDLNKTLDKDQGSFLKKNKGE
ncbi:hypothetical protein OS493_005798 [Desmophyllum pertusum]|uniref:Glomulin n=1 Tax=Desmophyllum pertusum TaxID=174260 RepID=A0A9W9YF87_9CNID|nr:hypothetical protein OS493_005798 [Desmophyllum pertusum]